MLVKEIFNYLKSFGYKFKMYDADGNGPILDYELVEYMYAVNGDVTLMIIVEPENSREYKNIYLYKTPEIKKNTFRKILHNIKRMGASYGYSTTVKSFGRKLTPKDFSIFPKINKNKSSEEDELLESFDQKSTKRTSYLMKEKAKVVIKHKSSSDNLKKDIKEMYVVSGNGEKRKVNGNNISLGKAIANHVNAGGNLYDDSVNNMFHISDQINYLSKMDIDDTLTECGCEEDQKESIKNFVKEARKQINKYIGNLARRKKTLDECIGIGNYNKPEHTFSKSFFSEITNNDDLADKLANISLFISIIKN